MRHIEKALRRGEYTALAGTTETLRRYRIYSHDGVWTAIPLFPNSLMADASKPAITRNTLRELDAHFAEISQPVFTHTPTKQAAEIASHNGVVHSDKQLLAVAYHMLLVWMPQDQINDNATLALLKSRVEACQ
jgi:hypothetical protein